MDKRDSDFRPAQDHWRHLAPLFRLLMSTVLLLTFVSPVFCQTTPTTDNGKNSLFAIGDVHGDFDDFVLILRHLGLIDSQQHWTGGASTLVQVGDLLDRGAKEHDVLDFLIALEPEAQKAGGAVVVLLGNHEMMNILGDLRYVTAAEYATFADGNSENRRRAAYKQYAAWYKNHEKMLAELPAGMMPAPNEAEWLARHPSGFIEQRQALAHDGRYGSWIRKHAAVTKIGDTIFLHGGIHPRLSSMSLDAINAKIRDEIHGFDSTKQALVESGLILPFFTLDEITTSARAQMNFLRRSGTRDESQAKSLEVLFSMGSWLSVNSDGPLWFRGYAQWDDAEGAANIPKLLQAYSAAHLVVGHTPQSTGRIRPRFDGQVFLIDTGMLQSYYPFGRASALKIENQTKFIAEYTDSEDVLVGGKAAHQARTPMLWDRLLSAAEPLTRVETQTAASRSGP
jgi:hypothetical protein